MIKIPKASLMQTGENEFIQIIPADQSEGELRELPEAENILVSYAKNRQLHTIGTCHIQHQLKLW